MPDNLAFTFKFITKELWNFPIDNVVDEISFIRFTEAFDEGTSIIQALCKPYIEHPNHKDVQDIILVLHALARVVDDAVDIGLPEDRIRMLKALPFIWDIAVRLQDIFPQKQSIVSTIIHRWCNGNNPSKDSIKNIGRKNIHLLLIEELLNNGKNRSILERSLVPLQLIDEVEVFELDEWAPLIRNSHELIDTLRHEGFLEFANLIQNNLIYLNRIIYVE